MLKHWLLLLHLQMHKQRGQLSNTTPASNAAGTATSEEDHTANTVLQRAFLRVL